MLGYRFTRVQSRGATAVIEGLRARDEWKFAGVLPRADSGLATA